MVPKERRRGVQIVELVIYQGASVIVDSIVGRNGFVLKQCQLPVSTTGFIPRLTLIAR